MVEAGALKGWLDGDKSQDKSKNQQRKERQKEMKKGGAPKPQQQTKKTGSVEELGHHTYTFGQPDSAMKFITTTEAISVYVGKEYGKPMRKLVMGKEKTDFDEPEEPQGELTVYKMEKFKTELGLYHRRVERYKEDKGKVFVVIWGQCDLSMQQKLEHDDEYEYLDDGDDVVGLVELLRKLSFSSAGQYVYWNLTEQVHRLLTIRQGGNETPVEYHRRFTHNLAILEAIWGNFGPRNTVEGDNFIDARRKWLACVFLRGADQKRCGNLSEELILAHIGGTGKYPESIEDALEVVTSRTDAVKQIPQHDNNGTKPAQQQQQQQQKQQQQQQQQHLQTDEDKGDNGDVKYALTGSRGWSMGTEPPPVAHWYSDTATKQ